MIDDDKDTEDTEDELTEEVKKKLMDTWNAWHKKCSLDAFTVTTENEEE